MMSWHRGAFWYLAGGSLYRLEPEVGRSRLVRLGADPGAWINSLGSRSRIFTLLLSESWPDSSLAVTLREKLRGRGWPAWVKGSRSGPFRVAVGASSDTDGLEPLAVELSRNGFEQFALDSLLTAGNSIPFPCGRVESPDGTREAYLTEAGPPGFGAGEVWISERHGLRQVRLVRAMLNPGRNFR
jgi:hypothetical protein